MCRDQGAIHQMCREENADEMHVGVCVRAYVCVYTLMHVHSARACVRERDRKRERECVCVCGKERVCVRHGERESVRGRERERNRES